MQTIPIRNEVKYMNIINSIIPGIGYQGMVDCKNVGVPPAYSVKFTNEEMVTA